MLPMNDAVREYLAERGRIAGKAGRGEAKRKGARASWTREARERRKRNLALKQTGRKPNKPKPHNAASAKP